MILVRIFSPYYDVKYLQETITYMLIIVYTWEENLVGL